MLLFFSCINVKDFSKWSFCSCFQRQQGLSGKATKLMWIKLPQVTNPTSRNRSAIFGILNSPFLTRAAALICRSRHHSGRDHQHCSGSCSDRTRLVFLHKVSRAKSIERSARRCNDTVIICFPPPQCFRRAGRRNSEAPREDDHDVQIRLQDGEDKIWRAVWERESEPRPRWNLVKRSKTLRTNRKGSFFIC